MAIIHQIPGFPCFTGSPCARCIISNTFAWFCCFMSCFQLGCLFHKVGTWIQQYTESDSEYFLKIYRNWLSEKIILQKDGRTLEMLIRLSENFSRNNDLLVVRDLTIRLLCFASFLRYNEVRSLNCCEVKLYESYISLYISQTKTDQYWQGSLPKVRPFILQKSIYFSLYRDEKWLQFSSQNKKLSYSAARSGIIPKLKLVGGSFDFALLPMRSSGATQYANS